MTWFQTEVGWVQVCVLLVKNFHVVSKRKPRNIPNPASVVFIRLIYDTVVQNSKMF